MKNQAFKIVDNLIILVHNANPPTDEESKAFMSSLKERDLANLKCLIFTEGGAPSAAQRRELNEILRGRDFPTAVVTSVTVIRGVVTALSWFNRGIKSFSPDEAEEAFRYLGIEPRAFERTWVEIRKLRDEMQKGSTIRSIKG